MRPEERGCGSVRRASGKRRAGAASPGTGSIAEAAGDDAARQWTAPDAGERCPVRHDADLDQRDHAEEGPAHRRLIRATLPRIEGQPPPTRPGPDFTIRQPNNRHGRFRNARGISPFHNSNRSGNAGGDGMPRQGGDARPRCRARERATARRRAGASAPSDGRRRDVFSGSGDLGGGGWPRSTCLISPENMASSSVLPTNARLAWAIAQAAGAAGARLALTYQGERLEENVRDLSEKLDAPAHHAVRRDERSAGRGGGGGHRSRVRRTRLSRARAQRSRRRRS